MKKFKRERGFYKELKSYYKYSNTPRSERGNIKLIEFWIEHLDLTSKDTRFYCYWNRHDEILKSMEYISKMDNSEYKSKFGIRYIYSPRTRKEKAIYKSRMHTLSHLNEIT